VGKIMKKKVAEFMYAVYYSSKESK